VTTVVLAWLGVAGIIAAMTVDEILAQLKALGDDARRAHKCLSGRHEKT
jgi:hypothetical protein